MSDRRSLSKFKNIDNATRNRERLEAMPSTIHSPIFTTEPMAASPRYYRSKPLEVKVSADAMKDILADYSPKTK